MTATRTFLAVPVAIDLTLDDIRAVLRAEGLRGAALADATAQLAGHLVSMRENATYRTAYHDGHTLGCNGGHSVWTCH